MKKILICGLGHIGTALATGLVQNKDLKIAGYTRSNGLEKATKIGIEYVDSISDSIISDYDYIIVSSRNEEQAHICNILDQFNLEKATIVSLASGVNTKTVQTYFIKNTPRILRIMPNLFSAIRKGTTLLDKKVANVDDITLFNEIGTTYLLEESQFSVGTILSGCSPAYLAYFMSAMSNWGQQNGLSKDDAIGILSDLFCATGEYLKNQAIDLQDFIDSVCVPGGVTIEGVKSFDNDNLKKIISFGLEKSLERDLKK